jgi:predicted O-linked N-acetylglucosamine transferase (SPINDLY family)
MFARVSLMTPVTIDQALDIALGHHQSGRRAEAEALYRQVLSEHPAHPGALHGLGVLAAQAGDLERAIDLIGRAVAGAPDVAEYQSNLGEFLRRAGRPAEAIAWLEKAIARKPDLAVAHGNLGNALKGVGRLDEAIASFERAIALDPGNAEYPGNLGLAFQAAGRFDEAIAAGERSVALDPRDPVALRNLGIALHAAGRSGEAITAYHRALALRADDPKTCCNLGVTLHDLGRPGEAIANLEHAIALDPNLAAAHTNLGNALWTLGRLDDAAAALRRAIALDPRDAQAYNNLGNVFKDQGRQDEAIAALRQAVALRPDAPGPASNLLFTLWAHPDYDARAILAEHRQWATRFAAPLAAEIRPHPNDRSPGRRLRVGYVSADFRAHPVGYLLVPLFTHHDRRQFEVVCYSDARVPDSTTEKLRSMADSWNTTASQSDRQLAERIRADRIDILVDLALHTAANRMLVFARKPAPVQVTMLGLPATTGLDTIDYRLTDPFIDPPGAGTDGDYTEQSIRLPHGFWDFPPPEEAPAEGPLPALANGHATFGCLNQFAKVTPPVLQLWREILHSVVDSRLVIQAQPGSHCDTVRAAFAQAGVVGDRLTFVPRTARAEYFQRYQSLDIGLDPFPYNGHNCTLEALWMGVPVVTLAGRTSVGRGGVSILSNLGLGELIARTPEEYVHVAVTLARDHQRLALLRAGLRQRMRSSPLTDVKQYTADVEAALRWMWQRWCSR